MWATACFCDAGAYIYGCRYVRIKIYYGCRCRYLVACSFIVCTFSPFPGRADATIVLLLVLASWPYIPTFSLWLLAFYCTSRSGCLSMFILSLGPLLQQSQACWPSGLLIKYLAHEKFHQVRYCQLSDPAISVLEWHQCLFLRELFVHLNSDWLY